MIYVHSDLGDKTIHPSPRPGIVIRPRLIDRLNEGLAKGCRLMLISASPGFGKTALVSEWIASSGSSVAWLSLDEGDNDPMRFISYLIAALQPIKVGIGEGLLAAIQSPQPPAIESVLTSVLNEISTIPGNFILVLDDFHLIDSQPEDQALVFFVEHQPPQMHLVIATREDPSLPLARLRARGQLTELRATDLRFACSEAAEFLNQVMGLNLSWEDIAALEPCTEGWIAGLQLAAISMQGEKDATGFIKSFTGSHRFVLDYLVEEVLRQQSESVQTFLLRTSILDRICGPLCDAVLLAPSTSGQETLEYLESANLFIVPLDNERRWYRYHHLFADLLRQRLHQSSFDVPELHKRASIWYEDNGFEIESFQHAAAANDIESTTRLIQGKGMPLQVRGGLLPVLNWLESLPTKVLDERPVLWVMYAGALTAAGQTTGVEQKLQSAEAALQGAELDVETCELLGSIANNRATLAVTQYQMDEAITQAHRALELLRRPDNLPVRAVTTWLLGAAYQFKGERAAANRTYTEALSISQAIGHTFVTKLATIGLGDIQETENRLPLAAETYQHALQLFGDQPLPIASEAHLGLARIFYEWNDLDAAEQHGKQSLQLARQYDRVIDRFIISEVFLARLKLALDDVTGAAAMLVEAEQFVRQHNFVHRMPEVAAAQVLVLLQQGDLDAAAHLTQIHNLPISQAGVCLSRGDTSTALEVLESLREQMEARGWADEQLKVMVLQAVAHHAHGEKDKAAQLLGKALVLAEPGGFIRTFVDEGSPMAHLLPEAAARGIMTNYIGRLLVAFESDAPRSEEKPELSLAQPLIESLSPRELKILQLIAQGLSNREIGERLFLALDTVKGHNRKIFDKLQVRSRTEAIAREPGLL